jgi:tetratricopeptide (TPR) repeat protein
MSLLLDALKEAESLKRPTYAGGSSYARSAANSSASEEADPLSLADEPVESVPVRPAAVTPPAMPSRSSGRAGVAELPRLRRAASRKSKVPLFAGLLVGIAVLLAGAFWYLSPGGTPIALSPAALTASLPASLPATVAPPVELSGLVATFSLAPAAPEPQTQQQPADGTWTAPTTSSTGSPAAGATARQAAPVVVSTRPSPLLAAYTAFKAGDLSRAEALYQETLAGEPRQPDAHLGLAVIAQSRDDGRSAMRHYREVTEAIPDHPRAWAGIADLASDTELEPMESRLRSLIATRSTAALHFALGNILMRQSRWPEAQESYFAASAAAPGNADYLFNLAVALDHLGKVQAAGNHYEQAIALAANDRAVQFNVGAASQRLATLRRSAP